MDILQTKEAHDIAREGHQVTREGHEISRQNVLDRLEQAQKTQEVTQAYRDKMADIREKLMENTIGHSAALEAMAQANYELRRQGLETQKPLTAEGEVRLDSRLKDSEFSLKYGKDRQGNALDPDMLEGEAEFYNKYNPDYRYELKDVEEPGTLYGTNIVKKWVKVPKSSKALGSTFSVTAPNGKVYTFPTQQQLDAFKAKTGLK